MCTPFFFLAFSIFSDFFFFSFFIKIIKIKFFWKKKKNCKNAKKTKNEKEKKKLKKWKKRKKKKNFVFHEIRKKFEKNAFSTQTWLKNVIIIKTCLIFCSFFIHLSGNEFSKLFILWMFFTWWHWTYFIIKGRKWVSWWFSRFYINLSIRFRFCAI